MKKNLLIMFSCLFMMPSWAQVRPAPAMADKLKRTIEVAREVDSTEMNMAVYPNPSYGTVNLALTGFTGKKTTLSVVNVIGTVIYHENLAIADGSVTKTLDFGKSAKGLYYIKLEADDYSEIRKVILR